MDRKRHKYYCRKANALNDDRDSLKEEEGFSGVIWLGRDQFAYLCQKWFANLVISDPYFYCDKNEYLRRREVYYYNIIIIIIMIFIIIIIIIITIIIFFLNNNNNNNNNHHYFYYYYYYYYYFILFCVPSAIKFQRVKTLIKNKILERLEVGLRSLVNCALKANCVKSLNENGDALKQKWSFPGVDSDKCQAVCQFV